MLPAMRLLPLVLALGLGATSPAPAHTAPGAAEVPALDHEAALRTSRAMVGTAPGEYVLRDRDGQPVQLASFRGKPLLVNFIYTGCFHVCPTSTFALRRAVDGMRDRFGARQFNVVSIGFNQPMDSPTALAAFAAEQRIDDPNWEFLSPAAGDVAALARDFGFRYVATPAGFDHTLQVSVLDKEGRIYRQVYGGDFTASALGEPLKQLLTGRLLAERLTLEDIVDRVRIICSVYDPRTGRYRTDYTLAFEIAGGITFVVAMVWFAGTEWRSRRPARRSLGA